MPALENAPVVVHLTADSEYRLPFNGSPHTQAAYLAASEYFDPCSFADTLPCDIARGLDAAYPHIVRLSQFIFYFLIFILFRGRTNALFTKVPFQRTATSVSTRRFPTPVSVFLATMQALSGDTWCWLATPVWDRSPWYATISFLSLSFSYEIVLQEESRLDGYDIVPSAPQPRVLAPYKVNPSSSTIGVGDSSSISIWRVAD